MRGLLLNRPRMLSAVILVALLAAGLSIAAFRAAGVGTPPPWAGSLSGCRTDPMRHVHDPTRLAVRQTCSTFTGTVRSVRFVPAYDDVKITLVPTRDMRPYLPAANHGVLVADVIATDQASVMNPPVGSRVSVWGAWVENKAAGTVMLLPAYRIVVDDYGDAVIRGHSTPGEGPVGPRQLHLSVAAPSRVVVGGEIRVRIHAEWSSFGRLTDASQIRLFTEMSTPDGVGVRWRAAETDTRGIAYVSLVAIQVPATYTLTAYAAPSKINVSVSTRVKIAKR
jgi:hypothetical protein